MTNQALLDNVGSLMSKKPVDGWVKFESLKKITEMSLEEIVGEIQVRGGNHIVCSWESRGENFPIIKDVVGGTREMTKDFFCRKILWDLRKKTKDLPIRSMKPLEPKQSNTPQSINCPLKQTLFVCIQILSPKLMLVLK